MVCTQEDDFIRDSLRWVVLLSNGETVFEDDNRPGASPPSAWKRLRLYCQKNHLNICRMFFQFRSNIVDVGTEGAHGYFFAKSAMAVWGEEETYHGYVGGTLREDGKIEYTHWLTPALIPLETGVRELTPEQSDCLIINEHNKI